MNAPCELVDVGTLDRGSYLGGGDIAALLGVSNWRTPLDVYLSKTNSAPPERPDPEREKRFRRGKLLEPVILEMLRQDYGIQVVAANHRYVDPEYPFLAAEIDFEWYDADPTVRNGEIKSVFTFPGNTPEWGDAGTEEVPVYYGAQSMWGLMITGRELCQYGVLFGGQDAPTLYHIRRDDETIAHMRQVAIEFWHRHVLAGVPPPPQTLGDLRKLYPMPVRDRIEATPEIEACLARHKELGETVRVATAERDELEFQIKEFVKDYAEVITRMGVPIATYRHQSRESIDAKRLKEDQPEVYEAYARSTAFRVLRHKAIKGLLRHAA